MGFATHTKTGDIHKSISCEFSPKKPCIVYNICVWRLKRTDTTFCFRLIILLTEELIMIEEIRKNLLYNVMVPGVIAVLGIIATAAYLFAYVL